MSGFIHTLIAASVRNRGLVLIMTILFAVVGAAALNRLKFDAFPDLTNVQVQVVTASPGMDSIEVEQLITTPIERSLGGVPGMDELRSISRTGVSSITVVFEDGTSIWHARQLVKERLDSAREDIPDTAGTPELAPPSTGLGEVYQFMLRSPRHRLPELYRIFEEDITPRLRNVDGVVEVNAWGGGQPQLDVRLDQDQMAAHKITLDEVESRVSEQVGRASGGAQRHGEEQILVRALLNPTTPEEFEEMVLRPATSARPPLLLGDIAVVRESGSMTVGLGSADARGEAIFVMVQLLAGADALKTVDGIRARVDDIEKSLPEGVELEPIYARDKLVENALSTVEKSLLEGGLLVIFILLILLGDFRAGIIVASVIPLSLLGAFMGLHIFGYSGNLMSLGAIDFGLVVDGSIVIVESIVALELAKHEDLKGAIVQRTQSVAKPVLFAIGILLVVYMPILMLSGTEGKLFRPMSLTVLFALGTALVLSFTYVPALATYLVKPHGDHQTRLMQWVQNLYRPSLTWMMSHVMVMAALVLAALTGSVALAMSLGVEFVPRLEEGDLVVQTTKLPSISADEALRSSSMVEATLRQFPEVEAVGSRTGSPAVATDPMGMEEADILVRLAPRDTWTTATTTEGLVQAMDDKLSAALPDTQLNFTQPIEMRFNEMLEGIPSDVGIKIYGPDSQKLLELADQIAQKLEQVPGASDVSRPSLEGVPSLELIPTTEAMRTQHIAPEELMRWVELEQRGRAVTEIVRGTFRDPVVLKLSEKTLAIPLEQRVIWNDTAGAVPVGALASVHQKQVPARIDHESGSRRVIVQSNVRGRDLGSFVQEAQKVTDSVDLPPGYWIEWGGKYEQLKAASTQMMILIPTVILIILGLLYMAFGHWKYVVLIALNVPVAISGGLVILWARGMPLSISALIGCVALLGIAVMNGIVMLSRIKELHIREHSAHKAAFSAALERLRPVLTTALVAGLGFVPMALASGVGAEVQRPLATVVIGGLVSCTTLTLFALPVFYGYWFGSDDLDEMELHDNETFES